MTHNAFEDDRSAKNYLAFLNSTDGKIQQEILLKTLRPKITVGQTILDAACGNGWLTNALWRDGFNIVGCDASDALLDTARREFSNLEFTHADVTEQLPYSQNSFDVVIVNMSAQDVSDLAAMYKHIRTVLKIDGTLLVTVPNPSFAFPIGAWKRGLVGALLGQKPKLKLRPEGFAKADPSKPVANFVRPLSEYLNAAINADLVFTRLEEIKSDIDSNAFDLNYRLFRYPLMLCLEFRKLSE